MQTKEDLFNKIEGSAQWNVGVVIARKEALPLDMTSTFKSFEEAQTYASTSVVAYIGQIVSVIEDPAADAPEGSVGDVKYYYIDQSMQLQELGKSVAGDDATIELKDGKLQLVGFESAQPAQLPRKKADGSGIEWVSVSAVVEGATSDTVTTGDAKSIASTAVTEIRTEEDTGEETTVTTGYTLSINGFADAEDGLVPVKSGDTIAWQDVYTTSEVDSFNSDFATELSELEATLSETASEVDVLSEALDTLEGEVATLSSELNSELDDAVLRISEVESDIAEIGTKITKVFSYKGSATVTVGEDGTITLTPAGAEAPLEPAEENVGFVYTVADTTHGDKEYVSTGTAWELLGTACDLSAYYTAAQVDSKFEGYYTSSQVDAISSELNSEIDHIAATLGDLDGEVATLSSELNSEIDAIIETVGTIGTDAEAEFSEIHSELSELTAKFADYYNSGEIDTKFAGYYTVASAEAQFSEVSSELEVLTNKFADYYTVAAAEADFSEVHSELSELTAKFANYYTVDDATALSSELHASIEEVDSVADGAAAAAAAASQIKIFRNAEAIDATAEAKTWVISGNDFGKNATVSVYHNGAFIMPDIVTGDSTITLTFNKGDDVTFEVGTIMVIVVGNKTTAVTDSPLTPVSA